MRATGLFLILLGSAWPALAQTPKAKEPKANEPKNDPAILAVLEAARKEFDVPGMAAAVVGSRGPRAYAVVGVRERDKPGAITFDDKFHIGSNTKMMTAYVLAALAEKKKLAWTDPLEKLLPKDLKSLTETQKKITLNQLTSHQAGFEANPAAGWWSLAKPGTPAQQRAIALDAILKEKTAGKPGEKFAYSNMSYVVAGIVAEKVAKKDWELLMQDEIFKPLGMKSAGFGVPGKTSGPADQPRGHGENGTVEPKSDNPPLMGPAGTVHVSIVDWAMFAADMLSGARGEKGWLKPESYKVLLSTPFESKGYAVGGWSTGRDLYAHNGSNTLNYATIVMMPNLDVAILVATNQGGDPGRKAVERVIGKLIANAKTKGRSGQ
jgi:CubicO group peptidase (beta-lactamase class C family)